MTKSKLENLPGSEPGATSPSIAIKGVKGKDRLCYRKPELADFGRIDQVTLGSGGSCTDGVNYDKALTGSGKCP